MKAGDLDRRISILRNGPAIDDGYTVKPGEFGVLCTRSASWKAANGREVFETMGKEGKAGGTFWVRSDSVTRQINQLDVVAYQGRIWEILGVQEIGRREGVELIVVSGDAELDIDLSGLSPTPPQSDIDNRVSTLEAILENVEIEGGDGLVVVGDEMRVDIDSLPIAPEI